MGGIIFCSHFKKISFPSASPSFIALMVITVMKFAMNFQAITAHNEDAPGPPQRKVKYSSLLSQQQQNMSFW